MDLKDKVALVTGGGRGIGRAIALKLAAAGASVVVNDISEETAGAVAEEVRIMGRPSLAIAADVSSADDAARLIDTTIEKCGQLDIMVNNAGIARDQLLLRMSEDDWDKVIDIDLKSVFLCSKAALRPMLKARQGRIINMASIVGLVGNPGQANYASAKAGVIGFTKAIAKEVASRNITVNAIAPGFIDTDMTKGLAEKQRQELMAGIPLGRLGTPEDVADAVVFLASGAAAYITGQVLAVDGGMTMR
jgi:3-oxoacyl-[acyl-carrier protein] reductase